MSTTSPQKSHHPKKLLRLPEELAQVYYPLRKEENTILELSSSTSSSLEKEEEEEQAEVVLEITPEEQRDEPESPAQPDEDKTTHSWWYLSAKSLLAVTLGIGVVGSLIYAFKRNPGTINQSNQLYL